MAYREFTDSELLIACKDAQTVDEIVYRLKSTSRRTVLIHLRRLGHEAFTLPRSSGRAYIPHQPLELLLTNGKDRNTVNLKKRIINAGLKEAKCEQCGITHWQGKLAPLQLDHIDGDRKNNLIDNLRILCPNCHAQTDTFCGKNIGRLRRQ